MFSKEIKCEPLWDGKEYINCKNCKIKDLCRYKKKND